MAGRKSREARPTLLVVGEGDCEVAFLKHLRQLYCSGGRGVTVTISNAHGKGPENVVEHTRRQARPYGFDQVVAFLDTDIAWSDQLKKAARQDKIALVGSTPCLEGFLLSILQQQVPDVSSECKRALRRLVGQEMTEREHYEQDFPAPVLELARQKIPELDRLLRFFEG